MRTSTPVQPFKRPDLQKASSVRRDTASSLRSGRFPVQESVHRSKDVNYASNGVTLTDKAPLAYRMIRFFLLLVLNTFFRDIEIIGLENVPLTGGAIIAGNHFNQFVDAMLLIACCPRILSFLMAAKSFQRAVIGWFAKKLQAIPVIRPQDSAVSGKGTITVSGNIVQGTDSSFQSQAENGGSIMIPSVDLPCKIKKITSDTEILLEEDIGQVESTSYKILKKVDQKQLYDAVYNSLSNGGCIGIFPEGGSHDRTDLLPLKAGIAVMALGFVEAHRREVSIIPCGFTYFEGHRFRSQVVVEFGQPIVVNPESDYAKKYSTDRKGAYTNLLEATRKGMESVTVTASSYDDLSAFHLARRLYQSGTNAYMTPFERAFLTRVFLNAYKSEETHEEMEAFKKKLLEFKQYIKNLGFELHQIKEFTEGTCYLVTALMLRSLLSVVLLLISIPGFVISSPIYFLAIFLSLKEMRHAKATSNVKVKGKDVIASYKLVVGFVVTPIVYLAYLAAAFAIVAFSAGGNLRWIWPAVGFFGLPLVLYGTIKCAERGVMYARSIPPLLFMLNPFASSRRKELMDTQTALEAEVVSLIQKLIPDGMENGEVKEAFVESVTNEEIPPKMMDANAIESQA